VTEPDLLVVEGLGVTYPLSGGREARAVRGVSLTVRRGEVLALVGESGSGKTSVLRAILRLSRGRVEGRVRLSGLDLRSIRGPALREARRRMQPVFQNPYASLNPRLTAGAAVAEPFLIHHRAGRAEAAGRAAELLARVGLDPARHAGRRPAEFSGGQRQRIAIARALAAEPELLLLDEPVSALDVSEQARILNLLADLRGERGLAYLLVTHDLSVVRHVADRIAVLYAGLVVEEGPAGALLARPAHPYTRALLAAAPVADPGRALSTVPVRGEPPDPAAPPAGCAFHPRCPRADAGCAEPTFAPALTAVSPDHLVACRHPPL
jgi:oligopeptide/dipeptide ABC transporter ATP-binding protein